MITRTLIAAAERSMRKDRLGARRSRQRRAAPSMEDLETRLALSSSSLGRVAPYLNLEVLRPGNVIAVIKPAPDAVGHHSGDASLSYPVAPVTTDRHVVHGVFSPDPTCGTCFGFDWHKRLD
jgi:hypothetical protein